MRRFALAHPLAIRISGIVYAVLMAFVVSWTGGATWIVYLFVVIAVWATIGLGLRLWLTRRIAARRAANASAVPQPVHTRTQEDGD